MIRVHEITKKLFEVEVPSSTESVSLQSVMGCLPAQSKLIDIDERKSCFVLVFEWEASE